MTGVQQCVLPRELAAVALQKAMVNARQITVSVVDNAGIAHRRGEVARMERGRPGRDPYDPRDEVTFTLVEHPQDGVAIASAPIALSRVRAITLL